MGFTEDELKELGLNGEDPKIRQFHVGVAKQCGPIIEKLAKKYYPDLTSEERSQFLIRDRNISAIIFEHDLQQIDWDEFYGQKR